MKAKLLSLDEIKTLEKETVLYCESAYGIHPAFFLRFIDRFPAVRNESKYRYAVEITTVAKLRKQMEFRNYNRTWRLWTAKPTKTQMSEKAWRCVV